MSRTIACIVEGDGEVHAVPLLLRRMAEAKGVYDLVIRPPIRVHRDRFLRRPEEARRQLLLARGKAGEGGHVLVLLDADDDCPVHLAAEVRAVAEQIVQGASVHVVIANREYEAWLLAAIDSLAGKRGLRGDVEPLADPDSVRNAKGRISLCMASGRYHEVSDQPALTARFDLTIARARSRSFRKLSETLDALL